MGETGEKPVAAAAASPAKRVRERRKPPADPALRKRTPKPKTVSKKKPQHKYPIVYKHHGLKTKKKDIKKEEKKKALLKKKLEKPKAKKVDKPKKAKADKPKAKLVKEDKADATKAAKRPTKKTKKNLSKKDKLPAVPEVLLRRRKRRFAERRHQIAVLQKLREAKKQKNFSYFKRAEAYIKEYRAMERQQVKMARSAKKKGCILVPAEANLAFVIRIKGVNQVHPKVRKILQLLRLRQINNGVFVKLNKVNNNNNTNL
ncbi:hypothetical protein Pmani_035222 [Petrolisthes manimaculis]|uniref:60S ribosomal protein L7 n=1 Tax=Petrolisthes manimaculis TaxID=1843537 RepID=A0AAE1TNW7_9EUCA|nr:hypothetical protein Pmani_035222 [Petrolisthes manimaculis]